MAKKLEVDVTASLGYQANGRFKSGDKKDYAHLAVKEFVCSKCNNSIRMSKNSFGESVLCPECSAPMYQQNAE